MHWQGRSVQCDGLRPSPPETRSFDGNATEPKKARARRAGGEPIVDLFPVGLAANNGFDYCNQGKPYKRNTNSGVGANVSSPNSSRN